MPTAAANKAEIGFQATDLTRIGLRSELAASISARAGWETIQTESADRAFGLYMEPSFGISYPTNPGKLSPLAPQAFARYNNVSFDWC